MNTPNVRYYARLENSTERGRRTPKYTITAQAGYYPPMEHLRGRSGLISMNLLEKAKEGENVPSMRLQAKGSLNFTGLKEYFQGGKLSGYAYGYPYNAPTYGNKNPRKNPFLEYADDGFLFIIHQDEDVPDNVTPTCIELIVLEHAKVLIPTYCKMLVMGGFDETLSALREQAYRENPL